MDEVRLTAGSSGKPLVRMFLSFARADEAIAVRLWEQLAIATAVDRVYEFELRRFDQALLVGSDWDACVRDALTSCELGVLALSDAFLGSVHSSIEPFSSAPASVPRICTPPISPAPICVNAAWKTPISPARSRPDFATSGQALRSPRPRDRPAPACRATRVPPQPARCDLQSRRDSTGDRQRSQSTHLRRRHR